MTLDSIKKWQWEVIYRMSTGLEAPMPSSEERSGRLASLSFILRAAIPDHNISRTKFLRLINLVDPKNASQFFYHFGSSIIYKFKLPRSWTHTKILWRDPPAYYVATKAPISLPRMDRHRSTHWPAKNPHFQMRDGSAANEMIIQKDTKVASKMKCEARILAL